MGVEQGDPVMTRIGEAVALGHAGDPLHRCALAHYAAAARLAAGETS